jgi:hypothetical protein
VLLSIESPKNRNLRRDLSQIPVFESQQVHAHITHPDTRDRRAESGTGEWQQSSAQDREHRAEKESSCDAAFRRQSSKLSVPTLTQQYPAAEWL